MPRILNRRKRHSDPEWHTACYFFRSASVVTIMFCHNGRRGTDIALSPGMTETKCAACGTVADVAGLRDWCLACRQDDSTPAYSTEHMDLAIDACHGRRYVLDGVHGVLCVVTDHYGSPGVSHVATPAGRTSEPYRAMRRQLGDDYSTTLSPERLWTEVLPALRISYVAARRA